MNIRVGTYLLILWSLIACNAHAAPDLNNLSINIDGIDYAVELEKSSFANRITVNLDATVEESAPQLELYQGTAPEVPGSWVAASYQDGEWQGMASLYDKLYELKGFSPTNSDLSVVGSNNTVSMQAEELELTGDFDMNNMCAMPHDDMVKPDSALASVVPSAGVTPTSAFAVGGITQAVNVVLALDQFHTNQYGNGSVARAIRILNNVDAIYRNSLGIALNNTAIVSYNNANPIFAAQTDTDILLPDLLANQAAIFGNSPRTLGALLTARNIQAMGNNGVAGIAYLNATCNNFAVSINEDRASEGVATVILAHEMGHNFGANHDPGNAICPVSTYIMSPVVANGLTAFSSCSMMEINTHIAAGTCYKQPIDISLARFGAPPPNNLAQLDEITRQVSVTNNGTLAITNIRIDGDIDNAAFARFTEVTINGAACTLLAAGKSYNCNIASLAAAGQQIISEKIQAVALGTFNINSSFDSSNVNVRIDIAPGNQSITDSRTVVAAAAAPNAPSGLNASAQTTGDIALTWTDNSNNELNFQVQRSANGGGFATIANLAANSRSYTDSYTVLTVGTAYTYQVIATNAIGSAPSNQSSATALERTATTPSNSTPSSSGDGGGGAIYLLTVFLFVLRVAKNFK